MILESAICPYCGAAIHVDSSMQIAFCMYCGKTFVPREAIEQRIKGIPSVDNDLERGQQSLESRDWQTAYDIFNNAVNKEANSFTAWFGCLQSMTEQFQTIAEWAKRDGYMGLESIFNNCFRYADRDERAGIFEHIDALIDRLQQSENKSFLGKQVCYKKYLEEFQQKKKRRRLVYLVMVGIFIVGKFADSSFFIPGLILFCLPVYFVWDVMTRTILKVTKESMVFHDDKTLDNIHMLSELLRGKEVDSR